MPPNTLEGVTLELASDLPTNLSLITHIAAHMCRELMRCKDGPGIQCGSNSRCCTWERRTEATTPQCTGADCNSIVHPHTPLRPGYEICGSSIAQRKKPQFVSCINWLPGMKASCHTTCQLTPRGGLSRQAVRRRHNTPRYEQIT